VAGDMIRVECECGKAARVPSRYAGRQVKCSGCGGKLTIPDVGASEGGSSEGTSGGAVGGPVGGPVGSQIGRGGGPEVETYRRPGARGGSGSDQRPRSDSYGRGGGESRPRAGRDDRGGVPNYGLAPKRRSSSSSAHDPYAPPSADLDRAPTYGRSGRGGVTRYLDFEAHIAAIGVWQRITGVLMVVFGAIGLLAMLVMVASKGGAGGGGQAAVGLVLLVVFGAIFLGFAALFYFIGSGLMKYKGWARIVMTILLALNLLQNLPGLFLGGVNLIVAMGGLLYGGAQLWALYNSKAKAIFSPGYAAAAEANPGLVAWWRSPFFWLPFVMVGLMFCVGASAGIR